MEKDEKDIIPGVEFGTELDLHHFHPKDTRLVVTEFLKNSLEMGYPRVKIIHGKGRSQKKMEVYRILDSYPWVISYTDDGANWGSTIVNIAI